MKKQLVAFGAVVCMPMLFSSAALASDSANGAYLIDSTGKLVRSGRGECWYTPISGVSREEGCNPGKTVAPVAVAVPEGTQKTPPQDAQAAVPAAAPVPEPAPVPVAIVKPEVEKAPVAKAPLVLETITVNGGALFEFDQAQIKPAAREQLSTLAKRVKSYEQLDEIVITGHADAIGGAEYNDDLSKRRAQVVKEFLQGEGVVSKRIMIEALGERQPAATNDTAEGRAENRRVDISIKATTANGSSN